jgi:hypothetical protein
MKDNPREMPVGAGVIDIAAPLRALLEIGLSLRSGARFLRNKL